MDPIVFADFCMPVAILSAHCTAFFVWFGSRLILSEPRSNNSWRFLHASGDFDCSLYSVVYEIWSFLNLDPVVFADFCMPVAILCAHCTALYVPDWPFLNLDPIMFDDFCMPVALLSAHCTVTIKMHRGMHKSSKRENLTTWTSIQLFLVFPACQWRFWLLTVLRTMSIVDLSEITTRICDWIKFLTFSATRTGHLDPIILSQSLAIG